ncbi:putative metal-binding motif-containing protein, partial [Candidatus Woesearchaeota archaeon]|nr:putative metal-binding motif-containing protein [Candidatus Woesearchaeota archaeon]
DNDGEAEAGESCDGTDLNGKSCNDFDDFKSGSLACDNTCNFDTSGCKTESDDDDDDDDDSGGGGGGGGGGKKIYPDTEERCDKDGDTYLSEECDGNDCNDYYAFINPGALEKCDNMDDDCDGRIDEGCDDDNDNYCDDNMGYSTHTRSCSVPGDCNDLEPEINPGVVEKCNNVDDNCNGKIDEGCTSEDYQISLSAEPEVTPRIFSKFKVSAYVENKMDTPLEKIKLDIEVPSSWEVTSPVIIQKLNAFEKEKITFDIIIKDYTEEKATLTLKATVNKNVIYESFDLDVVIPDFLVAVEPSLYDHKDKLKRGFYYLDFYYVINNKGKLKINYPQDIEFDINTGTITYALEYVSNLKIPADTIVINKIGSFDLPKGRQYFVEGTLWKNPSFLSKVKADQSREILILD